MTYDFCLKEEENALTHLHNLEDEYKCLVKICKNMFGDQSKYYNERKNLISASITTCHKLLALLGKEKVQAWIQENRKDLVGLKLDDPKVKSAVPMEIMNCLEASYV